MARQSVARWSWRPRARKNSACPRPTPARASRRIWRRPPSHSTNKGHDGGHGRQGSRRDQADAMANSGCCRSGGRRRSRAPAPTGGPATARTTARKSGHSAPPTSPPFPELARTLWGTATARRLPTHRAPRRTPPWPRQRALMNLVLWYAAAEPACSRGDLRARARTRARAGGAERSVWRRLAATSGGDLFKRFRMQPGPLRTRRCTRATQVAVDGGRRL